MEKLPTHTSHIFQALIPLFTVLVLGGCASGSALVTGQVRPAIEDHKSIRILTEMPEGAVEIAVVKASSDSGWTQQQSLDLAVEELKKQAGRIGANVVVLTGRDTSTRVSGDGTVISSSEMEIVHGIAVWLD